MLVLIFTAVVLGIVFLLIRQISNLSGKSAPRINADSELFSREALPRTGNTAQLEPFREPVGSVTEHTTRTFDEVFADKSKN